MVKAIDAFSEETTTYEVNLNLLLRRRCNMMMMIKSKAVDFDL